MTAIESVLDEGLRAARYPGAVCRVRCRGSVQTVAVGAVATHDAHGTPIATVDREPARPEILYDLASLTKVFTAITMLTLVDEGCLSPDEPIADHLESFSGDADREQVTLLHLLTHTSGLPPVWQGWRGKPSSAHGWSREAVIAEILALPLTQRPGRRLDYSCVGYITAMALAEAITGQGWDELVSARVLRPLGLEATCFNPLDHSVTPAGIAPTEYQPGLGRGVVRGTVHDETAWLLGGVSGNAGLFSNLDDLGRLAESIHAGLPGVLSPASFRLLWDDQLPRLLGRAADAEASRNGYRHAAGLCVGQTRAAGPRQPQMRSHTGFTGTSMVINEAGDYAILLSNRVHPTREAPDLAPTRVALTAAAGLLES